jgi:hypothetical protein
MDKKQVDSTVAEVKKVVKENKVAVAASAAAYYLSEENKERNALVAGLLAYVFLNGDEDAE